MGLFHLELGEVVGENIPLWSSYLAFSKDKL